MPFVQVTKKMAERRAGRRRSRQQFEIESLTGGLQRGTASAAAQFTDEQNKIQQSYQSQLADYADRLKQFESQTQSFKGKFDAYNAAVDRFNTTADLPGEFFAFRNDSFLPVTRGVNRNIFNMNSPTGQALAGVPGLTTATWAADRTTRINSFNPNNLPDTLVLKQTGSTPAGYPTFQLAQRQGPNPGEFNVAAPTFEGAAPDAPSFEGLAQEFTASVSRQREFTEREIGERKAGALRARRRMTDRTMLQRS